jgi:predicted kinase
MIMSKLLMLKGLPASGKSTYAKELVSKGWKRVNKDDLRAMIDSSKWSKENEKNIIEARDLLVIQYLDSGFNVVVDDTNFADIHAETLAEIADNCDNDVTFEVMFIDTPLIECIRRDALRGDKSVGDKVIMGMYTRYVEPMIEKPEYKSELSDAYIVDIDGTLAHMTNRSPYDYTKVSDDSLDENVASIVRLLHDSGKKIIIVSGRSNVCGQDTIDWLKKNTIDYYELHMRKEGDSRRDTEVKAEIYTNHIEGKYNVLGVFDDRDQVVAMWRGLGLKVYQVGYGSF